MLTCCLYDEFTRITSLKKVYMQSQMESIYTFLYIYALQMLIVTKETIYYVLNSKTNEHIFSKT